MGEFKTIVDLDHFSIQYAIESFVKFSPEEVRKSKDFFPIVSRMVKVSEEIRKEAIRYAEENEKECQRIVKETLAKYDDNGSLQSDRRAGGTDWAGTTRDIEVEKRTDSIESENGNTPIVSGDEKGGSGEAHLRIEDFF